MNRTIPDGFISDPRVLDVVFALDGVRPGDEIVLAEHSDITPSFRYAVLKVMEHGQFYTLAAPNDDGGYAMTYARGGKHNFGIHHPKRDKTIAWRRPSAKA